MASTTCGYCGVHTNLTYRWGQCTRSGGLSLGYAIDAAYTCDNCLGVLSTRVLVGSSVHDHDQIKQMVDAATDRNTASWQPPQLTVPDLTGVPSEIAAAASEAFKSSSIGNYRAAAVMARAVMEASAKDHSFTQGSLKDKIDAMRDAGEVTKYISEFAHTIRELGNDAAHSDFIIPIDKDTVTGMLELMHAILEALYKHRAKHAALRKRLEGD